MVDNYSSETGALDSLSSPAPTSSTKNDTTKTSHNESKDECKYSIMTIDTNGLKQILSPKSNISSDDKLNFDGCSREKSFKIVAYDPINVNVRQTMVPTLATGRRSKFTKLEGDAAVQREIRRKRNREAARKLKAKREHFEQQLQTDIDKLESKERELLFTIRSLESYKAQLELLCDRNMVFIEERPARITASALKQEHIRQSHQSVLVHNDDVHGKDEKRSPSPQWQLLFSI
ncbi:unnamed protein product [Rotaria magnacalcarata]|uniref:BZIP domain-containing protein n=5 Tax=Rotaria magnacalcarata TaxID=392030 RepID=A0A818WB69_9BILA|nr:unnamed protein product [Rotaria magnacalcarata]CAF1681114.1 unnamed protein product [Rotaria magnacalcarata]CAF2098431.1 unnamed protein product [Rotaria magnacalcarata]CAF2104690.1 unnamed protein product [Rotaria magnacalcarata]CAF3723290.1 unnamed protein product [Rotaria magnacalcarata]